MRNETYFHLADLWSVIFCLNWDTGRLSQGFYLSSSLEIVYSNLWSCKIDYAAIGEIERPEVEKLHR